MLGVFILLLFVVPFVELALIVEVADRLGLGLTLGLLLLVSVVGAILVKREGLGVLRRTQDRLAAGELPTDDVVDGLLVLVAGALLLTPGFVTDGVGLLLLFPPTRLPVRLLLLRRFRSRVRVTVAAPGFVGWSGTGDRAPFDGRVRDATVVEDDPRGFDRPTELGPPR